MISIIFRPLIYLAIIAFLIALPLSPALPPMLVDSNDLDWVGNSPGDPLDPGFVGETMSMPLDPKLIQKAIAAGIIKEPSSPYSPSRSKSGSGPVNLGTPLPGTAYDNNPNYAEMDLTVQSAQNWNITGNWSLDLTAMDRILRHMDLALVQNRDAVMGYGAIAGSNDTQRVTANGSQSGSRLALAVMPFDELYLYRLDLSLDMNPKGSFTAYSADGKTWSGDIAVLQSPLNKAY